MQESDVLSKNVQATGQQPKAVSKQQQTVEWLEANQAAITSYNQQVEKHGVFSDGLSLMDFAGSLDTDEADKMLRAINDKNSKDIDL